MSTQFRVPVLETFSWQKQVIDIIDNAPVSPSPSKGDRYIVGNPTPGDIFDGHTGEIAWFDNPSNTDSDNGWFFDSPAKGWMVYNSTKGAFYKNDGSIWLESDLVTNVFNVDVNRTDTYIESGSLERPFKTLANAIAATSSGDLIVLGSGTYDGDSQTLPDGVSLIGAGSKLTTVTGAFTTGTTSHRLANISFSGSLTINTGAGEDVYLADVPVAGGATITNGNVVGHGMVFEATSGPALTVNDGNVMFDALTVNTSDTTASAFVQNGGYFDGLSSTFTNNSTTAPTVNSSSGVFKVGMSSIKNSNTGSAASLENGASIVNPNILMGVLHNNGISCGTAHTIVQGVYSETPEDPVANDPTGDNLIFQHASQIRIDASQFSVQIPTDNNLTLQELLVWMDANFGGPGPLGQCTDETYADGLLEWTDGTAVNDAMDDVNEVLRDLAPSRPDKLLGKTLSRNQPFRTAKLAAGLDAAWYNGGNSADDIVDNIIESPNFVLTTPDSADAFGVADETALELYYKNTSAGTFDVLAYYDIVVNFTKFVEGVTPPQPITVQDLSTWNKLGDCEADGSPVSPTHVGGESRLLFTGVGGGFLAITDVRWYNNFNMWQKMNARVEFSSLPAGYHNVKLNHKWRTEDYDTNEVEFIYDDASSLNPSFGTPVPNITILAEAPVYVSGVKYYGPGSTFNVTAKILNLFNKTYNTTHVATVAFPSANTITLNTTHNGQDAIPTYTDQFDIDLYTIDNDYIELNSGGNVYDMDAVATITGIHPYKSNAVSTTNPADAIHINTYSQTRSSDTHEYFTDEQYRFALSTNSDAIPPNVPAQSGDPGYWDPSSTLTDGNALVYAQRLEHGGNRDLSGIMPAGNPNYTTILTSPSQYLRAFKTNGNPAVGVNLTLPDLSGGDVAPVGTGSVNVEVKLPGITGWLDAGADFSAGADFTVDGTGCKVGSVSGHTWNLTFGAGNNTTLSGNCIFVRITFNDTTKHVDNVMQASFQYS